MRLVDDWEEPTSPGVPCPRGARDEVAVIEGLCRGLQTYGFRVALMVPELRKGKQMTPRVRGRLGQDLRELGGMFAAAAAELDPASTTE